MKKILLLNPPAQKVCMRDYYCSKISKSGYYYHPIDFILLSGILSGDFAVSVLDCIALRLSRQEALSEICRVWPDTIIFLTGAVSMETDLAFIHDAKRATGALVIGTGDVFLAYGRHVLVENDCIDAALLDFSTMDIVSFLKDKDAPFNNIIYKDGGQIVERKRVRASGIFSIPMPRHELFSRGNYEFPFARHREFATVMTDFGCPFSCTYCTVNSLGYKTRDIDGVMAEFKSIRDSGIKEAVFKDQTFNADGARALTVCSQMIKNSVGLGWTCFARADLMSRTLAQAMADAGCHTVIFGVESVNQVLLAAYQRKTEPGAVCDAISLCHEAGIETVGTFIIGLPGDTQEGIQQTIKFARDSGCDYASFNIFTPAYGATVRRELIGKGLLVDRPSFMDGGISMPCMDTEHLNRLQIWALRKKAVASFYFRPAYLARRLSRVQSFFQAKNMVKQYLGIVRNV